jgi:hypothetical protein
VGAELRLEAASSHLHRPHQGGERQIQGEHQSRDVGRQKRDVHQDRERHRAGSVLGALADAHRQDRPGAGEGCTLVHQLLVHRRAGHDRRWAVLSG